MALHQTGTPCIGIATWGCVNKRHQLEEAHMDTTALSGGDCIYPYQNDKTEGQGALLNANHSHFILVDTGLNVDEHSFRPWGGGENAIVRITLIQLYMP